MRERTKDEERNSNSNWLSKWEEDLPAPEDLTPLHQTLITPDLALAFNIPNFTSPYIHHHQPQHHQRPTPPPPPPPPPPSSHPDFDNSSSAELTGGGSSGGGAGSGSEEPARTLKRPRLVWTPQLHKRFVDAVAHLGIKNAVPKTIMQLMSVDGLTRENVASHLQKYRLYLKRMQGLNTAGGGGAGTGAGGGDPATDHLFASSPVPPHFLHQSTSGGHASVSVNGRHNTTSEQHFLPYVPPAAMAALHHHQHMTTTSTGGAPTTRQIEHNHHQHHSFLSRQAASAAHIGGMMMMHSHSPVGTTAGGYGYVDEIHSAAAAAAAGVKNGREVLTLFPTTGGD